MKKILLVVLTAAISILGKTQWDGDKDPYLVKSLTGSAVNSVEVKTSGGSIAVAGVSTNARIEVYVRGNNGKELSKEEIQKRLEDDYNLDINFSGGRLSAVAKQKHDWKDFDWKKALNISFKVYVAQDVNTDLNTSGGSISLNNPTGSQRFSTSGGSLNVSDVSGQISGNTSGGSINVTNAKQQIDLSTSGGSINAKNCSGNIKLETSGGSLHLDDLDGDINANTSGGSIEGGGIKGELKTHTSGGSINLSDLYCSLETSTSGGSINVDIAALGKYVKIDNNGGDIHLSIPKGKGLNLDLEARKISIQLNNFDGNTSDDRINGKINGGGIPVDVSSGSGRISVTWK